MRGVRTLVAKKTTKKTEEQPTTKTEVKTETTVKKCRCEPVEFAEEHRVLSHLMYIAGLVAGAFAFLLTLQLLFDTGSTECLGVKALLLLGWAYFFKTFAHRIHNA